MSLRRDGRMHHLGIGAANARQRVVAIVDEHEVTVVALDTGEVLSTHRIEPERTYWRDQRRDPGRWPGPERPSDTRAGPSVVADVLTHVSHMSRLKTWRPRQDSNLRPDRLEGGCSVL